MSRGYIGCDFDGTLAYHEPGHSLDRVGVPIPAMVERVKVWLAEGQEVRIITARVARVYPDRHVQRRLIHEWCEAHLGQRLIVQDYKCGGMIELWDDRAVQVIKNTGISAGEHMRAAIAREERCTGVVTHGEYVFCPVHDV